MRSGIAIIFGAAVALVTQVAIAQTVSRAYIGEDGKAHVVYAKGTQTIAPEDQQVGCDNISVAEDGHTVGWSVLVDNCCTSYPIPTVVVVYKDGHKNVVSPAGPTMIHGWRFVAGGKRVAVLFGPVHGDAAGADLYDSWNGKILASWNAKGAAPSWAKDWENE